MSPDYSQQPVQQYPGQAQQYATAPAKGFAVTALVTGIAAGSGG